MSKTVLLAIAAAVMFGAIGAAGPAKAMPLAAAAQAPGQFDRSMVVQVKYHRPKHRPRPGVSFHVTVPGMAPSGMYYGPVFHPYFHVDMGAPYHCHEWSDNFGRWQQVCHRHW
jgi:hypothetical protein